MKLEYWFQNNNLMINIEKTIAMSYRTTQNKFLMRPKISYKNTDISYKLNTKILGIYIAENLKWTTHINTLRLQFCKMRYIIKSVEELLRSGLKRCLHQSKFELLVRNGMIFS